MQSKSKTETSLGGVCYSTDRYGSRTPKMDEWMVGVRTPTRARV